MEIKFEDRGDYIYFEDLTDRNSYYVREFEFTYKFVRYKCLTNRYSQYYYEIYDYLVKLVIGGYEYERVNYNPVVRNINKEVEMFNLVKESDNLFEIVAKRGLVYYYIEHKKGLLDIDEIDKNIIRYNIGNDSLEIYNICKKNMADPIIQLIRGINNTIDNYYNIFDKTISECEDSFNKLHIEYLKIKGCYYKEGDILLCKDGKLYRVYHMNNSFNGLISFDYNVNSYLKYDKIYFNKKVFEKIYPSWVCRVIYKKKNISGKIYGDYKNVSMYEIKDCIGNTNEYDLNKKDILEKIYKGVSKQYETNNIFHDKSDNGIEINTVEDFLNNYDYNDIKIYTYLIKNKRNGLYKIGKTKNIKHREKTLQSEEPEISVIKTFDSDIESILHDKYSDYRVRGEWFKLSKIQIKYICTNNWELY
jgi:hypothetical protein